MGWDNNEPNDGKQKTLATSTIGGVVGRDGLGQKQTSAFGFEHSGAFSTKGKQWKTSPTSHCPVQSGLWYLEPRNHRLQGSLGSAGSSPANLCLSMTPKSAKDILHMNPSTELSRRASQICWKTSRKPGSALADKCFFPEVINDQKLGPPTSRATRSDDCLELATYYRETILPKNNG